jgi:hypothetical protein
MNDYFRLVTTINELRTTTPIQNISGTNNNFLADFVLPQTQIYNTQCNLTTETYSKRQKSCLSVKSVYESGLTDRTAREIRGYIDQ